MNISSDKLAEVAILARDLPAKEREFDAFVIDMTNEEQTDLVAVFWIGRGAFEASEWAEAVKTAQLEASVPTQEYLKGSPHLADHIEAGMTSMGLDPASEEDALYRSA